METANQNCPVCNSQIQDGGKMFCPICKWELISIPSTASQGLINFYKEKLELHKAAFKETDKLNEEILTKKKQLEKLESQKEELEAKNKSLNSDITSMNDKVKNADVIAKEITQLKEKYEALKEKNKALMVENLTVISGNNDKIV